jgi:tetratricopeptide (TPR) repeat protein
MNPRRLEDGMTHLLVTAIVIAVVFVGCAVPRVMILSDPLSSEEHLQLGIAYERKGEFDNAIKEYGAAAKKVPVAFLYLGNVYFQKNDFDKAEKYYRKAIRKDRSNADAHNNLAWLYYVEGRNLDQAEKLALTAIKLDPSKKEIYQDTLEKIGRAKSSCR